MLEALSNLLTWLLIICMAIPALAGLAVLLIQCVVWLSSGEWESASVIDVLGQFLDWPWLYQPTEWIGLWKLLDRMPFIIGSILAVVATFITGSIVLTPLIAASEQASRPKLNTGIPPDLKEALSSVQLLSKFSNRPNYQQKGYIKWVAQASDDETREARIKKIIREIDSTGVYFGQHFR